MGREPELVLVDDLVFVAVDIAGSGNRRPVDFRVAVFDVLRETVRGLRGNLNGACNRVNRSSVASKLAGVDVFDELPEALAGVLRRHRRHRPPPEGGHRA